MGKKSRRVRKNRGAAAPSGAGFNPLTPVFRLAMNNREHTDSLVRMLLSPEISERLTADPLVPGARFLLPDDMSELYSDQLISAKFKCGLDGFIYAIMDHRPTLDLSLPIRLPSIMSHIWCAKAADLKDGDKLPPIIPLVLCRGEGPAPASRSICDRIVLPKTDTELQFRSIPYISRDVSDLEDSEDNGRALLAGVRDGTNALLSEMEFKCGTTCYVYMLLLYRDIPDPLMSADMLGRISHIWHEALLKSDPGASVPPTIVMVFSHADKKEAETRAIVDRIAAPEGLEDFIRTLSYDVCDLSKVDLEALSGDRTMRLVMSALAKGSENASDDPDVKDFFENFLVMKLRI